jgi:hypothetical protein
VNEYEALLALRVTVATAYVSMSLESRRVEIVVGNP